MAATLGWVGRSCTGRRSRWVVRGVAALVVALGVQQAVKLAIGYTEPGSPLLWPISNFNRSSSCINATYGGCNDLVIYMQGDRDDFGGRRHSVVVDTQLRFSAEMALLLGLLMITLAPAIFSIVRPKFVARTADGGATGDDIEQRRTIRIA